VFFSIHSRTIYLIVSLRVTSNSLARSRRASLPSVTFEGDVAVGTALPDTFEIHTIPDQPDYGYVVVNKKRVLVNPKTRTVIEVIK
jgi:hypothetical protein